MRIVCDNCGTKYSIPDDRVRNKPFKIRCKKCSYVIVVQANVAGGGAEEPGWYVVIAGEQVGPVSTRDVEEYYYAGQVDAETYIWRDGLPDWVPLSQASEFAHVLAAAPAGAAAGDGGEAPMDEDDGATRQVALGELYGSAAQADAPAATAGAGGYDESEEESTRIMSMESVGQQMGGAEVAAAEAASSSFEGFGGDDDLPGDDDEEEEEGSLFSSLGGDAAPAGGGAVVGAAAASAGGDGDFSLSSLSGGASDAAPESPRKSGDDLVGARSENSVLFSLSNLQAISAPSKADKAGGGELPTTEGSGLIDIKALAASQAAAPADKRQSFGGSGGGSGGSDAFEGSVIPVPAMMPMGTRKSNTGLIVGIAAGALVFITLIVVVVVLLVSDDDDQQQTQVAQQEDSEEEEDNVGVGAGDGVASGGVEVPDDGASAEPAAAGAALPGAKPTPGPGVDGPAEDETAPEEAAVAADGGEGESEAGTEEAEGDAKAEEDKKEESSSGSRKRDKERKKDEDKKRDEKKETKKEETKKEEKKETKSSGSSLSKSDVQKTIRGAFSKVRTCSRNAEKKGKLIVSFKIKGDGRVSSARIASSEFKGTRVGACVVKVVEGMKFPAHGGSPVPVKYPFSIQ